MGPPILTAPTAVTMELPRLRKRRLRRRSKKRSHVRMVGSTFGEGVDVVVVVEAWRRNVIDDACGGVWRCRWLCMEIGRVAVLKAACRGAEDKDDLGVAGLARRADLDPITDAIVSCL